MDSFYNKRHTFASSFFHNLYFFVLLASCFFQQTLVVISHVIRATNTFYNFGTSLIAGRLRFLGGSLWYEERKWHSLTSNNCTHKSLTYQNGFFLQQETYLCIFLFSQPLFFCSSRKLFFSADTCCHKSRYPSHKHVL